MRKSAFLYALAALAAGLCHWYASGLAQRLAARALAGYYGGDLRALLINVALEEALRLALIGAAAYALSLSAERPPADQAARLRAFALLSGWAFGSMENLSYLVAFPSLDIFWRLGYSLPIHVNAGLLYALARRPTPRGESIGLSCALRRALGTAAALGLGIAWHGAFNAFASLAFFNALPALGSALNAAAFIALALLLERNTILRGVSHGRTRA